MVSFPIGQRIRVIDHHPEAWPNLWSRCGVITVVLTPRQEEEAAAPRKEQRYQVRFDGIPREEIVWQSWLERE